MAIEYSCGERIITAKGRYRWGEVEVNDSSIWTRLIQEAGRKCDWYASDILIWYESYMRVRDECIRSGGEYNWMYGFRTSGVDECEQTEGRGYISVFSLDLKIRDNGTFTLELRRVN